MTQWVAQLTILGFIISLVKSSLKYIDITVIGEVICLVTFLSSTTTLIVTSTIVTSTDFGYGEQKFKPTTLETTILGLIVSSRSIELEKSFSWTPWKLLVLEKFCFFITTIGTEKIQRGFKFFVQFSLNKTAKQEFCLIGCIKWNLSISWQLIGLLVWSIDNTTISIESLSQVASRLGNSTTSILTTIVTWICSLGITLKTTWTTVRYTLTWSPITTNTTLPVITWPSLVTKFRVLPGWMLLIVEKTSTIDIVTLVICLTVREKLVIETVIQIPIWLIE